jgi:hypothetical protein
VSAHPHPPASDPSLEAALDELRRSLEFGRSHVVLLAARDALPGFQQSLEASLQGEVEVVRIALAGRKEPVAECLHRAIRDARRVVAPPRDGQPHAGAPHRARLLLVVPDALSVLPTRLRTLHDLTTRAGASQRLLLMVDRDTALVDDPAGELASRLGAGISKIELQPAGGGARRPFMPRRDAIPDAAEAAGSDPVGQPARALPPTSAPPRVKPIPVRRAPSGRAAARGRRPRGRGAAAFRTAVLTALVMAGAGYGAVVATPRVVERLRISTSPGAAAVASRIAASGSDTRPAAAAPSRTSSARTASAGTVSTRETQLGVAPRPGEPGFQLPPVGRPRLEPLPAHASAPEPEAIPEPAGPERGPAEAPPETATEAPEPVQASVEPEPPAARPEPAPPPIRIAVNFNATPWADLQIDGRGVGPTPLAGVQLTPGEHRVVARFPDGRVVERKIRVDALENRFRID